MTFQPFLRFYTPSRIAVTKRDLSSVVSTLLEILLRVKQLKTAGQAVKRVSTLLEILHA